MKSARAADPRFVKSRAALRAALVDLLTDHRLEDIAAVAVAEKAGVGYATFFRHYRDPLALLLDVADEEIAYLVRLLSPIMLAGDLAGAMRALASHVGANRSLYRALLVGGGDALRQELVRRAVGQGASAPQMVRMRVPLDLAIRHMVSSASMTLGWWLERESEVSLDEVARFLHDLAIRPVVESR